MSARAGRFSDAAISIFVRRLALLLQDLGFAPADIEANTAAIRLLLGSGRREALLATGAFLERRDIARRWNAILSVERGPFLGRLVGPHVVGSILDLLSGNGSVARFLERSTGAEVATVERLGHDSGCISAGATRDFDDFQSAPSDAAYDTVLLCTVLHHEWAPVTLLDLAARVARRRIILVENCIDDDCPAECHELVDLIFNDSLNKTSLPCPGSHRSLAEWLAMGAQYGEAKAVASVPSAPGIPLSHDVIVIERGP